MITLLLRSRLIILVLCILNFYSSATVAGIKIWETDNEYSENINGISIKMHRNFSHGSDPKSFQISAFQASTHVWAIFRGACNKLVKVKITTRDYRKLDLERFEQTGSGMSLPIVEVMEPLRNKLLEQCDNSVEAIRIDFNQFFNPQVSINYNGIMQKNNHWKLEDGWDLKKGYDYTHKFTINFRDIFSPAGIYHEGYCESHPTLLLEPRYSNKAERALSKPLKFNNFTPVALEATELYLKECPDTQQINFAIRPMPEDYQCRDGQECYLVAKKSNNWEVNSDQFKYYIQKSPITDFDDMIEVLAAGEFKILKDYDKGFFNFFVETFFGAYSEQCASNIKQPVKREIITIEREYDSSGFVVNERIDGPKQEIWIEESHGPIFDKYFNTWRAWASIFMMSEIAKTGNGSGNPIKGVKNGVGYLHKNINQLHNAWANNCEDERMQTAYQNMVNYVEGHPAVTGMFVTDKKPLVHYSKQSSSAPKAVSKIEQSRQLRLQERKEAIQERDNKLKAAEVAKQQAANRIIEYRNKYRSIEHEYKQAAQLLAQKYFMSKSQNLSKEDIKKIDYDFFQSNIELMKAYEQNINHLEQEYTTDNAQELHNRKGSRIEREYQISLKLNELESAKKLVFAKTKQERENILKNQTDMMMKIQKDYLQTIHARRSR